MADLKSTADGGEEKRHSRRPVWRSLKVATNTGPPNESHNKHATISASRNDNKDQLETSGEQPKSRLSNWLSQQLYEHERQAHYSPTWIDDRDTPTMSNLSLVSHISSASGSSDLRKRPMSVPTSPASPTIPRFLMTPVISNTSNSPVAPSQPRLLTVMTAKMVPPSSPTTSTHSRTTSHTPSPPPPPHAKPNYQIKMSPSSSTDPAPLENAHYDGDNDTDSDDDENDDTYKTAGGSTDYSDDMDDRLDEINDCSEDMDDRLDEINDYSDNSIYYTNRYYDDYNNNNNNNNKLHNTHSTKITPMTDDLLDDDKFFHNDISTSNGLDKNEYSINSHPNSTDSNTEDAHDKSIFDSMDPEVAQVLLEWRRQSLLKIDWFDMFATKSNLWRSTTLFLSPEQQQQQQQDPSSLSSPSCQSSIATTSIDSLHFKGVPLDKAFRSYSKKIDYAKARVSDIDHALQVFAQLYWECNPTKLFQCAELVYIIIHSLMLLNTDVHAGQEHRTVEGFCNSTIDLVLANQASIPIMLFDAGGESTWHQAMTECLQSLYKSVKRSSLLPSNQLQPWPLATTVQRTSTHHDIEQPQEENGISTSGNRLDTAFNDLFITATDTSHSNPRTTVAPKKSISTPQKKSKQRHQRSNSLAATPSWTLLRRRDTHRSRFGPYKEGPLSCQLNGEAWKICWVILHLGHLHIYHHQLDETITTTTPTPISKNHANTPPLPPSETNKSNKVKKKFMQHLSPSPTVTHPATNFNNSSNHGQLLKKKKPYQEVDIHLGNTFCEKYGPHVFLLQLANGSNTYIFDCGSELQVTSWIRDINFWAARETKIVLSRGSSTSISTSSTMWKRPPPPAGASVLDKQGQQQAIDTYLLYLQTELKHLLQQPGWATSAWQDKKMYLELEIRKYQCYHDSIYQ